MEDSLGLCRSCTNCTVCSNSLRNVVCVEREKVASSSPRSRRHQDAAASHNLSSRSQSYLRDWVDAASHIHTDSSQSYLQWRRRLLKIAMNELLQFKTKFVSLISKRQTKTCCWFHSFILFTSTTLCWCWWREEHNLSMLSACFP